MTVMAVMTEQTFEKQYMRDLNPQQREAVRATDGPVLLLAVPGSGKTSVLVTRLGYLAFVKGVPPEKILAVTYTVAATREMKSRYVSLFGAYGSGTPEFRTINGLSQKIIDCYGRTCSSGEPFRISDGDGALEMLLRGIYREVNGSLADDSTVRDLRTGITYAKNMMLNDEETENLDCGVDGFPEILRRYGEELRNRRQMDFDDQMVYACRILRQRPQVLKIFRDRFPHVCVDESQDTSRIQHAILRLLAGERANLFMVGDEDQSIYGFRAAYPEALMRFREDYPGARILYLEQNYRSTPEIVEAANRFVSGSSDRYPKTARAVRASGAPVRQIAAADRKHQFEAALRIARKADRETHQETAFLYRNNDTALPLIDRFEREGIRYNCRQFDEVFFSSRTVQDLRDLVSFLRYPADGELFLKLYYKFNAYITRENAAEAAKKAVSTGEPVLNILLRLGDLRDSVRDAVTDLKRNMEELPRDSAAGALERIRDRMGYGRYLRERQLDSMKLDTLLLLAQEEKSLFTLMERLEYLRQTIGSHVNREDCLVNLSTIHSAKGLEFERVYLLDLFDGLFPSVTVAEAESAQEKKMAQEERRLFYVAMTRAKDELWFISQGKLCSFICEATGEHPNPRKNSGAGGVRSAGGATGEIRLFPGSGNGNMPRQTSQSAAPRYSVIDAPDKEGMARKHGLLFPLKKQKKD